MASGLNRCEFIGNLGADPKWEPDKGTGRCAWSMGINEAWKDRDGNKQESTEWVHVVAWGKLGENCAKYLAKGRQAYVAGKWKTRFWEGQDGQKKYMTEIEAREVVFLGGGQQPPGQGSGYTPPPAGNDDIPF